MITRTIRCPDDVYKRLRIMAAMNEISVEEQIRRILAEATQKEETP
jgi:plasmid stability protein